ncbi:MAG: alpha/beta fold hydrolase [Deltaproteobacteria bacterium]|jgi:haloalkane dehalogenase|nr:alpha/beta fold hydrolase [Deltaproteobacteria bacterium]
MAKKAPGSRLPLLLKGPWILAYPFRFNYFERSEGGYLHYLDEGQGPPVLMVHGNPSWSFMYRSLIKALSPHYRCLVPDHLGMGLSSRPKRGSYGFRLMDRVNDLTAFIDSLNLTEPIHLVAHDWGGPIGLGWAGLNPQRVASITLMNTGLRLPKDYVLPFKLSLFRNTGLFGQILAKRFNLFLWGLFRHGSVRPLPSAVRQGWLAPYRLPEFRQAISRFVEDIPLAPNHPSWSALQNVDKSFEGLSHAPLFLVWGLQDFVFDPAFLADFQARRPKARVLALPRAGHLLLEDEPEQIASALSQFLGQAQSLGGPEVP